MTANMTPNDFINENGEWLDKVAEENDDLGSLIGVNLTMRHMPIPKQVSTRGHFTCTLVSIVQLIFDHGIVSAYQNNLHVFSNELFTRMEEHTQHLVEKRRRREESLAQEQVRDTHFGNERQP